MFVGFALLLIAECVGNMGYSHATLQQLVELVYLGYEIYRVLIL